MSFSKFPIDKPFKLEKVDTSLSEIGLRLVVNFYSDSPYIIGTATVISDKLLLTAKRALTDLHKRIRVVERNPIEVNETLVAVQIINGTDYVVWDIVEGIYSPTEDIAILQIEPNPARSNTKERRLWKRPSVEPFEPKVGDTIVGFGYRRGRIVSAKNSNGGYDLKLDDEPITSVGSVIEVHSVRRERGMYAFPCFQVDARFDHGMSGGPVFNEAGDLCGIVCGGLNDGQEQDTYVSYVSLLWPIFRIVVGFERGDGYPQGIKYIVLELAKDEL